MISDCTVFGSCDFQSFKNLKGIYMTEGRQEALRQALHYHSMQASTKKGISSPDAVVKTARKFESFLMKKKK